MDISSCEPSFNSSIPQSQSCYLACISIQRLVTLPQAVRCTKGCFPGMSILQTCNYCLPIPTSPAVLSLSFSSFTRTNNALAILLVSPTLLEPRCTHPKRKALSVAFAGRVACMPLLCSTPFSGAVRGQGWSAPALPVTDGSVPSTALVVARHQCTGRWAGKARGVACPRPCVVPLRRARSYWSTCGRGHGHSTALRVLKAGTTVHSLTN
jgi:hypothetical protein